MAGGATIVSPMQADVQSEIGRLKTRKKNKHRIHGGSNKRRFFRG